MKAEKILLVMIFILCFTTGFLTAAFLDKLKAGPHLHFKFNEPRIVWLSR